MRPVTRKTLDSGQHERPDETVNESSKFVQNNGKAETCPAVPAFRAL
jgi:hypothetical protein